MQAYTHRCESYIQHEQGEVVRYKNHAELFDRQSKDYDRELRQAEHVLALNKDKVVHTEQAAREAVLRAQKDSSALADIVAINQQALQTFEQQHQLALQYHEHGSHQELSQKDRLFDEMAAAQSKLEFECQQLKSRLAQQEHGSQLKYRTV
jgi:hypothetical protein